MNSPKEIILSLRKEAEERGITQQEIADKAGMKRENVSRLFSATYPPTLSTICKVADAIGVTVQIKRE